MIAPSLSFRRPSLLCWPSISAKLVTSHKWEVQTAAKVFAFSPPAAAAAPAPYNNVCLSLSPHCVCVVYSNWLCSNRNNLINIRSSSSSSYIYNFPGLRRAFARPFDVAPIETFSLSLFLFSLFSLPPGSHPIYMLWLAGCVLDSSFYIIIIYIHLF